MDLSSSDRSTRPSAQLASEEPQLHAEPHVTLRITQSQRRSLNPSGPRPPWVDPLGGGALTWKERPQPKGASGGGDASDDAVEQEADVLAVGRRQQEDPGPCGGGTPESGWAGASVISPTQSGSCWKGDWEVHKLVNCSQLRTLPSAATTTTSSCENNTFSSRSGRSGNDLPT